MVISHSTAASKGSSVPYRSAEVASVYSPESRLLIDIHPRVLTISALWSLIRNVMVLIFRRVWGFFYSSIFLCLHSVNPELISVTLKWSVMRWPANYSLLLYGSLECCKNFHWIEWLPQRSGDWYVFILTCCKWNGMTTAIGNRFWCFWFTSFIIPRVVHSLFVMEIQWVLEVSK